MLAYVEEDSRIFKHSWIIPDELISGFYTESTIHLFFVTLSTSQYNGKWYLGPKQIISLQNQTALKIYSILEKQFIDT